MRALTGVAVFCGLAVLSGNDLRGAAASRDRSHVVGTATRQLPNTLESTVLPQATMSELRVRNLRLDEPSAEVSKPAVLLKFDLLNDSASRVTDVLIEIAIVEKSWGNDSPRRFLAGPITIRGYATIEAGYTVKYKVLLRNLASDCECEPRVSVLSARPVELP